MKRPTRSDADGKYHIHGKTYPELFGSRQKVWNGTSYKTTGGLVKDDLMMNKWRRIVSRKKHATAKKEMRLLKHGYGWKKGEFGYVKKNKTAKNRSRKGKK
jgi:DVNP family